MQAAGVPAGDVAVRHCSGAALSAGAQRRAGQPQAAHSTSSRLPTCDARGQPTALQCSQQGPPTWLKGGGGHRGVLDIEAQRALGVAVRKRRIQRGRDLRLVWGAGGVGGESAHRVGMRCGSGAAAICGGVRGSGRHPGEACRLQPPALEAAAGWLPCYRGAHHGHHSRAPQQHGAARVVQSKLEAGGAQLKGRAAVYALPLLQRLRARCRTGARGGMDAGEHPRRRRRRPGQCTCGAAAAPLAPTSVPACLENKFPLIVGQRGVGVALQRSEGARHAAPMAPRPIRDSLRSMLGLPMCLHAPNSRLWSRASTCTAARAPGAGKRPRLRRIGRRGPIVAHLDLVGTHWPPLHSVRSAAAASERAQRLVDLCLAARFTPGRRSRRQQPVCWGWALTSVPSRCAPLPAPGRPPTIICSAAGSTTGRLAPLPAPPPAPPPPSLPCVTCCPPLPRLQGAAAAGGTMTEFLRRGAPGMKSVKDMPVVQDGPPPGGTSMGAVCRSSLWCSSPRLLPCVPAAMLLHCLSPACNPAALHSCLPSTNRLLLHTRLCRLPGHPLRAPRAQHRPQRRHAVRRHVAGSPWRLPLAACWGGVGVVQQRCLHARRATPLCAAPLRPAAVHARLTPGMGPATPPPGCCSGCCGDGLWLLQGWAVQPRAAGGEGGAL